MSSFKKMLSLTDSAEKRDGQSPLGTVRGSTINFTNLYIVFNQPTAISIRKMKYYGFLIFP